ncbi:NAD(P)/FAD-dependent oxidoreductase [Saccharospirillum salsuginis]|uniref:D-amino-acid dehydrogenase n=1 Tax=Saccharospirillum salsuginis TaxID=418750 RepID=A0A918KMK7_9GAMM|nr:FAD-dependent oxidoreductase [Saccharospirillum salsuginis]GGX68702.1 D-amino-acid dehydrogenase [Saccharospirillum salsuginis]
MRKNDADIIVVGAGIIGITCALALQSDGRRVLLLDRSGIAAEASRGNAGAFAFTDVEPLATPGILRKAPKWLIDPLGPLSLPIGYAPKLTPWLLRFWRSSWRDRFEAATRAQSALMQLSQTALENLIRETDAEPLFQRDGQLQVYAGAAQFEASRPGWALKQRHGIDVRLLDHADDIASIQPGLDARFTHAGYTPDWMNVCNPVTWATHLATAFQKAGGHIESFNVTDVDVQAGRVCVRSAAQTRVSDRVVIAGGAWSGRLAWQLGDRLPLDTERGYNTTLPAGAFDVKTHISFPNDGFVVSRIDGGVRVGGAVEFGGLKRPPNYRRADILLEKASRYLPGLRTEQGQRWMGFRPSMPDSLPVIGPARCSDRVIYCFGHGHLGLTQSSGTAQLVKAMVTDAVMPIDRSPYSPRRFSRWS